MVRVPVQPPLHCLKHASGRCREAGVSGESPGGSHLPQASMGCRQQWELRENECKKKISVADIQALC